MKTIRIILLLICIVNIANATFPFSFYSAYFEDGAATETEQFTIVPYNVRCFELTPNNSHRVGVAHYSDKIELYNSFEITFQVNFGNKTSLGADGIAFVFHNDPAGFAAKGDWGAGIGYAKSPHDRKICPSFAVEFDTYQNAGSQFYKDKTSTTNDNCDTDLGDDNDGGDPALDHISFVQNGMLLETIQGLSPSSYHYTPSYNGIVSYINIANKDPNNNGEIEDGKDHCVKILWSYLDRKLEVYFDNQLAYYLVNFNLVEKIFGTGYTGDGKCYIAFTSATGILSNKHTVCVESINNKTIETIPDEDICDGEEVKLKIHKGGTGAITWTSTPTDPSLDPNMYEPIVRPNKTTTYTVRLTPTTGPYHEASVTLTVNAPPVTDNFIKQYDTYITENSNQIFLKNAICGAKKIDDDCSFLISGVGMYKRLNNFDDNVMEVIKTDLDGSVIKSSIFNRMLGTMPTNYTLFSQIHKTVNLGKKFMLSGENKPALACDDETYINIEAVRAKDHNGILFAGVSKEPITNGNSVFQDIQLLTLDIDLNLKGSFVFNFDGQESNLYPYDIIQRKDKGITLLFRQDNTDNKKTYYLKLKDEFGDNYDFITDINQNSSNYYPFYNKLQGYFTPHSTETNISTLQYYKILELDKKNEFIMIGLVHNQNQNTTDLIITKFNDDLLIDILWSKKYSLQGNLNYYFYSLSTPVLKNNGEAARTLLISGNLLVKYPYSKTSREVFVLEIKTDNGDVIQHLGKDNFLRISDKVDLSCKEATINNNIYKMLIGRSSIQKPNPNPQENNLTYLTLDLTDFSIKSTSEVNLINCSVDNLSNYDDIDGFSYAASQDLLGFGNSDYILQKSKNVNTTCANETSLHSQFDNLNLSSVEVVTQIAFFKYKPHIITPISTGVVQTNLCPTDNSTCGCDNFNLNINVKKKITALTSVCCYIVVAKFISTLPTCTYKKIKITDEQNNVLFENTLTTSLNSSFASQNFEFCMSKFSTTKTIEIGFYDINNNPICSQKKSIDCECECDNTPASTQTIEYKKNDNGTGEQCCYDIYLSNSSENKTCTYFDRSIKLSFNDAYNFTTNTTDCDNVTSTTSGGIKDVTIKQKGNKNANQNLKLGEICITGSQTINFEINNTAEDCPVAKSITLNCAADCCDNLTISNLITTSSSSDKCCVSFDLSMPNTCTDGGSFLIIIKGKDNKVYYSKTTTSITTSINTCLLKRDILSNSGVFTVEVYLNGEVICSKPLTTSCVSCCDYFDLQLTERGCDARFAIKQLGFTSCADKVVITRQATGGPEETIVNYPLESLNLLNTTGIAPALAYNQNYFCPPPQTCTYCKTFKIKVMNGTTVVCSKSLVVCCTFTGGDGGPSNPE